ncbi:MAG: DUF29 domain-containing protein [Desulfurellales bacterium]|nr:MAG: DUF29 domain-containing protein [Desulfurellales bacterium]
MTTTLYETDFYAWTQRQAALLREEEFTEVDWNNLIEEIEALGRSDIRELTNRLEVLLMHLLKWRYQPGKRGRSWRATIDEQRRRLHKLLRESPSLRAQLTDFVGETYPDAIRAAVIETGLDKHAFSTVCPWTAEQIMDEEFWPRLEGNREGNG